MRKWVNLSVASLLLLLPFTARAQQSSAKTQTSSQLIARNGNSNKEVQYSVTRDPRYEIGPGDVIDINVWKEPDISRTLPVRPDGMISLPLLSDVQAAGLTPAQLAAQITKGLNNFLTDPQVTVMVMVIKSQRIFILGEVARPGEYSRLPGMTLLQALSSTGGFTPFANLKNIYILREENGKQVKYPFNYKEVVSGRRPEENILLQVGDTIVVP
jgi:polysaccharide biosynthesis/export protein